MGREHNHLCRSTFVVCLHSQLRRRPVVARASDARKIRPRTWRGNNVEWFSSSVTFVCISAISRSGQTAAAAAAAAPADDDVARPGRPVTSVHPPDSIRFHSIPVRPSPCHFRNPTAETGCSISLLVYEGGRDLTYVGLIVVVRQFSLTLRLVDGQSGALPCLTALCGFERSISYDTKSHGT